MNALPQPSTFERTNPLEEEAISKLAACRTWKSYFHLDLVEMYFMTAPHRQRQISSMTPPAFTPRKDAPELNTSLGYDLVGEFITEVVNTFMPEAQPWCERAWSNGAGSRSCAATDSANDRSASAKRPSLCSRSPR